MVHKVVNNLLRLKKTSDDAITKFMNSGQVVDSFTTLRTNIDKINALPIVPQVDLSNLKVIHDKINSMLPPKLHKLPQSFVTPRAIGAGDST